MTASEKQGFGGKVLGLFRPAIWGLNRLRYAPKFLVLGLLVAIPFAYVTYLQYQGTTHDIQFNRYESIGVEYLTPVKGFYDAVQRHRLYSAAASLDATFKPQAEEAAADAERFAKAVDAVDARYGGILKTSEHWKVARDAWTRAAGAHASAADADKAHEDATLAANDLIVNYAANYSNLILDPDLDSYYLMDAYIAKLPTLGANVTRAATTALLTPAGNDRTIELAGLLKLVASAMGDLESTNMATAFKETANFGKSPTLVPQLSAPLADSKKTVAGFNEMVRQKHLVASDAAPGLSAASLKDTVTQTAATVAALDGFDARIGPELRWLADRRVDAYHRAQTNALAAAMLAGLLLIYLFVGFFLAVRGSVEAMAAATKRMIAGTSEQFDLGTSDELGQIAASYNEINDALVEVRALRKKVQDEADALQANIMDLLQVVSTASDGDLTSRASMSTGALGNVADAFNQLMESMQELIGDVHQQVKGTQEAIEQISHASQLMVHGAAEQTREINSARLMTENMSVRIGEVASTASNAALAAKRTEDSAAEGARAVENVIDGMDSLRSNVQAGAKKMKNLGDRSMEITGIVGTINRISEQTNMLALNAAIEAARAGEHGRGFSVVAEEVRKLAERTAAATQEIEKLVKVIHAETNETIHAIEQQTQVVEQESQIVGTAGEQLKRIREMSTESALIVVDITNVANQQMASTKQVVQTMTQISGIAAATQTGAQGTVETVGRLLALSGRLSAAVGRFKVQNGRSA
jgi:methyl-accepting chemotaxis protein